MSTISVGISYEGTEQGAAQIGRLKENLSAADTAQRAATRSASDMARQQTATTAAVQAALTKWSAVGTALGQVSGAVGRLGPEFSGLAATLGSVGQSAQSVINALAAPSPASLVSAVVAVSSTVIDGMNAWYDYRDAQNAAAISALQAVSALNMARTARDQRTAVGQQAAPEDQDIAAAAVAARRAELSRAQVAVGALRASGSVEDFQRAEAARASAQAALDRALATHQGIVSAIDAEAGASDAAARRDQERLDILAEMDALLDAQDSDRPQRRRSGSGDREQTFAQLEAAAWREAEERRGIYESALEEGLAQERALIDQKEDVARQLHENAMERQQIERDGIAAFYDYQRQREEEALDKAKEASRERMRSNQSLGQEAGSIAKQIGSAYFDAFQVAIEGTMSLEDALLAATKQILKSIGEELVARGIGKILEGIAEIPSPTAATKIGGGVAMVGFGIGLGAAGAAIPSPNAGGAESPREERDTNEDRGPGETTIIFGNPVLTAGTQTQLARGMGRAFKGDRSFPSSVGR